MRDFNQELEKTRGAAHALELAVKALIDSEVVADKKDPSAQGVRALAEVLADRLDDLAHMLDDLELMSQAGAPLREQWPASNS
jgi:hypothetical protein